MMALLITHLTAEHVTTTAVTGGRGKLRTSIEVGIIFVIMLYRLRICARMTVNVCCLL